MKSKVVGVLVALSVIFGLVAGCAAPKEAVAPEEGATPEAKGEVIECIASVGMAMYPEGGDATLFDPYLHYLSDASARDPALQTRFKLLIRDAGALYNQNDAQTAVAQGAIQLTYSGPHFLEQWDPAWKLLEAPGVIDDWGHFMRVMETEAFKELVSDLAKEGVTILNWIGNIGDVYCYTDTIIEGIDGMKGLKIRYFAGEAQARALTALGADAIFLPYTEVITAFQTHQLQGIWTDPPSAFNYYQLYRYCPCVLPYRISIQPLCMVCNTKWLESLPSSGDPLNPDVRESFLRTFQRIETWRAGDEMAGIGWDSYLQQKGTYCPPFDEAEFRQMQKAMTDAQAEMFAAIAPKYMEAIESVRGSTAPWSPASPLIRLR